MSEFRQSRYSWILLVVWCTAVTLLLYGGALSLPFFFDDFVHYPFVAANPIPQIWLETTELAYYRPLNFTIWRVTFDLLGEHNPLVDHGINLALHAMNGFLVGWLAARLWAPGRQNFPLVNRDERVVDWWRALLASTLFLLFPFSYQAVPWIGSMSHLLVTALILLSLFGYVQMRRNAQRLWGVVSLFFALLAPFAHENGVLVMPFVVLIALTTPNAPDRWRRAVTAGIVWSLPLLLYVPIWLSLPRVGGDGLFPNSLEGMLQNATYFVQGLAFPLTSFGGWLMRRFGLNDMVTVWLLSGLALGLAAAIQLLNRASLRSLLPWLWYLLASVPAVLFLIFDYVINGPRLLMVASVGAAWLWTDVVVLFARGVRPRPAERALRTATAVAFVALIVVQSVVFIRERMQLHAVLGDGFTQVIDATVAANENGLETAVVNFPSWLAPRESTFALGHEGVLFWPDYIPPAIFMAVHTGEFGDLTFVQIGALRPQLEQYYYGPTGPLPDWDSLTAVPTEFYITQYTPQALALQPAGVVGMHNHGPGDAIVARFRDADGQELALLAQAVATQENGQLRVDLLWEVSRPFADTTVFVHVVDAAGNLLAQSDGDPLGGSYPFDIWRAGSPDEDHSDASDVRLLPLPEGATAVRVGLYNRQTGERITAVDGVGAPLPDNALTIPVE